MIWLTWRQHRLETMIAAGALALFAVPMLLTGLSMAASYHTLGIASCLQGSGNGSHCQDALNAFEQSASSYTGLLGWANFVPLVLGLLLGAPFVLDIEHGTYRLAWTQSITRARWVSVKVALITASAAIAGLLLVGLVSWWRMPLDHVHGSFTANDAFDFEGIVPVTYTIYAAALVVVLGTLFRRVIPAIGVGLVAFLAARLTILNYVRPHYVAPISSMTPAGPGEAAFAGSMSGATPHRTDWVLSSGFADRLGHHLSDSYAFNLCARVGQGTIKGGLAFKQDLAHCLASHHIYGYVSYQPASRFWLFQGIEGGIFLGLSAALLGGTVWWVSHRMA